MRTYAIFITILVLWISPPAWAQPTDSGPILTNRHIAAPFADDALAASLKALRRDIHARNMALDRDSADLDEALEHFSAALAEGLPPEMLPHATLYAVRLFALRGETRAAAMTAAVASLAMPAMRDDLWVEMASALRRSGDDDPEQLARWLTPLEGRTEIVGLELLLLDARMRTGAVNAAADRLNTALAAGDTPEHERLCTLYPALASALSGSHHKLAQLSATARAACMGTAEGQLARSVLRILALGRLAPVPAWTPEQRLFAAGRLYARVKHDAVIAIVKPLIESPDSLTEHRCEALWRTAMTLKRSRRASQSVSYYQAMDEACAEISDWHMRALYGLGWNHFREGNYADAITLFERLFETYRDTRYGDDALFYLVRAHVALDDLDAARQTLEPILSGDIAGDLHGEVIWRYLDKALTAQPQEALAVLERARVALAEDDNYNSEGRWTFLLAFHALEAGETERAIPLLRDVVERFPLSFYAYMSYSHLDALGDDKATAFFDQALARAKQPALPITLGPLPDDDVSYRALAWIEAGWSERAAVLLERARGAEISEAEQWCMAFAYQAAGRYDRSHDVPRRVLKGWDERMPDPANRALWELAYPRPYRDLVLKALEHDPMDEMFAYAIMREESAFRHDIESFAHAVGLMQMIEPTGVSHAKRAYGWTVTFDDLRRPQINVPTGIAFLAHLERKLRAHPVQMAAGYNAGRGASNKWYKKRGEEPVHLWTEHIPYNETRNYAKRVNRTRFVYQMLYADTVAPIPLSLHGKTP